tara:strand:+ start:68 stop:1324 length:1257 start_codon:yes stop_codon:yes gene_type:complete
MSKRAYKISNISLRYLIDKLRQRILLLETKIVPKNFIYISNKEDFPAPVNGIIQLNDNITYYIVSDIDLTGDRIVSGDNSVILGASSENCSLTSTGLDSLLYMITTEFTMPVRHITFKNVSKAIDINTNNIGVDNIAIDWYGVNFSGCDINISCGNISNFIFSTGSVLDSGQIIFNGNVGTIAFNDSLFIGDGTTYSIIKIADTANISRRFRTIYSSFVTFGSTVSIEVDDLAAILTESYILDNVNFSGGGVYLNGLDETSNKSFFVSCIGIKNTSVNGQMYMLDNDAPTIITNTVDYIKVVGTTIASAENSKYNHSDNRLTNTSEIERKYRISCSLSFNSGNNNECQFGFYDSKLGAIREPSKTKSTANNAGRAESVTLECVIQHSLGEFIEVHARNLTASNNITVTDLNVVITEFK